MADNPFLKYVTPKATTPAPTVPVNPFERYTQPGVMEQDPSIPQKPRQTISTGADILLSGAAGAGEGLHAIPGQLGDVKSFMGNANDAVRGWLGLDPISPEIKEALSSNIDPPTTADLMKFTGYNKIAHVPQTPEGKIAKSATSTAAQSVFGGPRAVLGGAVAGLGGEAAGQATEGTWAEPIARIVGGLGAGVTGNAVLNAYKKNKPRLTEAPTFDALDTTADFGFEFARQLGAEYDGDYLLPDIHQLYANLRTGGGSPITTPKSYGLIEEMFQRARGGTLTISDLHAERKAFGKAARDFNNPEEQAVAMQAIAMIDKFIRNPDPKAVLRGDAKATAEVWGDAMDNYAGAMRLQRMENAGEEAVRSGKATHSGLNIDNKLRQKAAWFTNPNYPARRAGLDADEVTALKQLADGNASRNALRAASKVLGGGGGLGQAAAMFFGGSSVIPDAAGAAALGVFGAGKSLTALANRIAQSDWKKVAAATARRTPLGGQMPLAPIPVTQMTIPEILAATTGPMREDQQTPRLDRGGVAAVTNALIPQ